MADVVKMMEPLKRYLRPATTVIDNNAFRIHYQVTCGIYLLFFIISFARKYFGDPILCHLMTKSGGSMGGLVTIFCWGKGTYTIEETNTELDYDTQLGQTHPGVGTYHPDDHKKMYHDYYQWVGLWLVFQMVSFYIIRLLWKMLEGGKMAFLVKGVNELRCKDKVNEDRADMDEYEEDETKEQERLKKLYSAYKYLFCNSSRNNLYASKYIFCEILLLIHVIAQFHFTDLFLGGNFSEFGLRVFDPEVPGVIGVLDKVFPKVTICDFDRHGAGGDIINKDVMCVLPLNIVNEKIFLLLWFWMVTLIIVSILNLIYRMVVIVTPGLRVSLMFKYTTMNSVNKKHINLICRNGDYGDWFIMKLFMKNIHHDTFVKFLAIMAMEVKNNEESEKNRAKHSVAKDETKVNENQEQETTDDESFVTVINNVNKGVNEKHAAKEDHHKALVHAEVQAAKEQLKNTDDKETDPTDTNLGPMAIDSDGDGLEYCPSGDWFQPDIEVNYLHASRSLFDTWWNTEIDSDKEAALDSNIIENVKGGGWFDPSVLCPVTDSVHKEDKMNAKSMDEETEMVAKSIDEENELHAGNLDKKDEVVSKKDKQYVVKFDKKD